eukprot:SAG25_NODE_10233_length_341_cov_2.392562_1_plen_33_part_01
MHGSPSESEHVGRVLHHNPPAKLIFIRLQLVHL